MKVFVLSSNSHTENGIENKTRVFSSEEKAMKTFQEILKEIKEMFPEEEWNDNMYESSGDFETEAWVQDQWHWWSLKIEEKDVE